MSSTCLDSGPLVWRWILWKWDPSDPRAFSLPLLMPCGTWRERTMYFFSRICLQERQRETYPEYKRLTGGEGRFSQPILMGYGIFSFSRSCRLVYWSVQDTLGHAGYTHTHTNVSLFSQFLLQSVRPLQKPWNISQHPGKVLQKGNG